MKTHIYLLPLLIIVCGLSVFSQSDKPTREDEILTEIIVTERLLALCANLPDSDQCKNKDYEQRYQDAIVKAVKYPKLVSRLLMRSVQEFEGNRLNTRSAPQVSQIADEQNAELIRLIVVQNQEIIRLLKVIAKEK